MPFLTLFKSEEQPKHLNDLSRKELMKLTTIPWIIKCPFATCQVENLFRVSRYMLKSLSIEAEHFEKEFDAIIIGSYIIACAYEEKKYYSDSRLLYPLTAEELVAKTNVGIVYTVGIKEDDSSTQDFIYKVGMSAIEGQIPFDLKFIEYIKEKCTLVNKHVLLDERWVTYLPNHSKELEKVELEKNKSSDDQIDSEDYGSLNPFSSMFSCTMM